MFLHKLAQVEGETDEARSCLDISTQMSEQDEALEGIAGHAARLSQHSLQNLRQACAEKFDMRALTKSASKKRFCSAFSKGLQTDDMFA